MRQRQGSQSRDSIVAVEQEPSLSSSTPVPSARQSDLTPRTQRPTAIAQALLVFQGILLGATESVNLLPFLLYCIQSPKMLRTVRDCVLFNGVLFVSLWVISSVLYLLPINNSGIVADMFYSLLSACWVLPVYIGSQLLGLGWYQDLHRIASSLRHKSMGVAELPPPVPPSFDQISDTIYKFIVTALYGLIAVVVAFVPIIGEPISFVVSAWLHAWYCFDYRFADQRQYDPTRRAQTALRLTAVVDVFEHRWAYFLGFGSTHIAIRMFLLQGYFALTLFPALAICSTMYALNVVMAVDARPLPVLPSKLPVFSIAYDQVSRIAGTLISSRHRRQQNGDSERRESPLPPAIADEED
jgi:hypothetical protein